jgi:hypothetical protein
VYPELSWAWPAFRIKELDIIGNHFNDADLLVIGFSSVFTLIETALDSDKRTFAGELNDVLRSGSEERAVHEQGVFRTIRLFVVVIDGNREGSDSHSGSGFAEFRVSRQTSN